MQPIMEELPITYSVDGEERQLIKRSEKAAIYKVVSTDAYEVFKIRIQQARTREIAGKIIQTKHREVIPRNEDFGKTAWFIIGLEKAESRFEELQKEHQESQEHVGVGTKTAPTIQIL